MRKFPTIRGAGYALVTVFVSISSGCALNATQREAVATFSSAAVEITELAEYEIHAMREGTIQVRAYNLALERASARPSLDELAAPFTFEAVSARLDALEALRTYGKLLYALVEDTQQEELRAAADDFGQSIEHLPFTDRKLSYKQIGAVSDIVYSVGRLVVEAKKAEAVKRIVAQTEGQVSYLCELLANDFNLDYPGLLAGYSEALETCMINLDEELKGAEETAARAQLAEMFQVVQAHRARRDLIEPQIRAAVLRMRNAHEQLAAQMEHPELSLTDIEEFAASLKQIRDNVQILRGPAE